MKKIAILLALMTSSVVIAQNPLVTHMYTADPTARVHNGKLYVYPSTDMVPPDWFKSSFCMPGYNIFSLEGGSTWRDHGTILTESDVKWAAQKQYCMWAPDCVEKDGKFYYFFPAKAIKEEDENQPSRRIGVGVSDSPDGGFVWEDSYIKGVEGIDPGLLVDDKGDAYLFFGSGDDLQVAPLAKDMKRITKKPIIIQGLPGGFKEGSFPFQREGRYYLTFAHKFNEEGFTLGYATSDSPMGPYRYQGKMMDNIGIGTNHQSVVNYQGRWILFYHWWEVSGMRKLRSICADYMEFNKDGTIKKVVPTRRGIGAPMVGDTIQIDRYNVIDRAKTAFVDSSEPKGWMVCEAENRSYVIFNDVDFEDGSAKKMLARIACGQNKGTIEVRLDSPEGQMVAEYKYTHTGAWDKWVTLESPIKGEVKGRHNLCVVFTAEEGSTKTANLNWLLMER